MKLPANPLQWSIGLVGYGEVGRILAEDLRARGVSDLLAYDIKLGSAQDAPLRAHAAQYGVRLMANHAALARAADLVISAVTADQTLAVAVSSAPTLKPDTWFLDFNSASPSAKIAAAALIDAAGGRYVEGAVMTSIPPHRIRVPLLLGGPGAAELAPRLTELGFVASVASAKLGVASATKMCRSVMIKGLEAMVFQRVIEHGRRRAEEMREVAQTVREAGLAPCSAAASAERDAAMAALADAGVFGARGSGEFARSADWRIEADRILAAARK